MQIYTLYLLVEQGYFTSAMGSKIRKPNKSSEEFARLNDKGVGLRHGQKPISVMLPPELDAWVRSLPNRSEWIREAIRKQYEQEAATDTCQDSEKVS